MVQMCLRTITVRSPNQRTIVSNKGMKHKKRKWTRKMTLTFTKNKRKCEGKQETRTTMKGKMTMELR